MRVLRPSTILYSLSHRPILLDSGMGTRLMDEAASWTSNSLALVNLSEPRLVWQNHSDDFDAGSDAVVTNTFRADRPNLERAGRGFDFHAVNRDGVQLAREAAGPGRFVIGSIAPISGADIASSYREQAQILIDSGCDALLLETHTFEGAIAALESLAELVQVVPILTALWLWPPDLVSSAKRLEDLGAAALGMNCGDGLDDVTAVMLRLAGSVNLPLIAKPSAGLPGRPQANPEAFADSVPKLIAAGIGIIGGCCGTTPQHVAAMRHAIRTLEL